MKMQNLTFPMVDVNASMSSATQRTVESIMKRSHCVSFNPTPVKTPFDRYWWRWTGILQKNLNKKDW